LIGRQGTVRTDLQIVLPQKLAISAGNCHNRILAGGNQEDIAGDDYSNNQDEIGGSDTHRKRQAEEEIRSGPGGEG
jgi:hypothetical protein